MITTHFNAGVITKITNGHFRKAKFVPSNLINKGTDTRFSLECIRSAACEWENCCTAGSWRSGRTRHEEKPGGSSS